MPEKTTKNFVFPFYPDKLTTTHPQKLPLYKCTNKKTIIHHYIYNLFDQDPVDFMALDMNNLLNQLT